MGFDLIPFNKSISCYSTNISGWGCLIRLVDMLGCNVSKVSFMNDGKFVPKKHALQWAKKIETVVATGELQYYRHDVTKMIVWTITPEGEPLRVFEKSMVEEFVNFLYNCGGFRIY